MRSADDWADSFRGVLDPVAARAIQADAWAAAIEVAAIEAERNANLGVSSWDAACEMCAMGIRALKPPTNETP